MSLLNDALRKKNREPGLARKTNLFRTNPDPRRTSKARIYGLVILIVIFGALTVFGAWHGFLRASSPSEEWQRPKQSAVILEKIVYKPARPLKPFNILVKEASQEKPLNASTVKKKDKPSTHTTYAKKGVVTSGPERAAKPATSKALKAKKNDGKGQRRDVHKAADVTSDPPSHRTEDIFYEKAISYHRRNNLKMAIQMYLEVLRKNPAHTAGLLNLSSAYIQSSLFMKASILLNKLKRLEPENPQVSLNLAMVEIGLGKPTEAITYLERAEALIDEPHFEVYFHRGVALSHLHKLDEALIWYKKAEVLCADHPLLLFNLAVACDKLERYVEALRYYVASLNKDSGSLTLEERRQVEARIDVLRVYMARK